jgi:hypothetical protein
MWFMFEKIAISKGFLYVDSPVDSFLTGVLMTNTNSSTNIRKNLKIISVRAIFDQAKLFDEKETGDEKFRDTVPLWHYCIV